MFSFKNLKNFTCFEKCLPKSDLFEIFVVFNEYFTNSKIF